MFFILPGDSRPAQPLDPDLTALAGDYAGSTKTLTYSVAKAATSGGLTLQNSAGASVLLLGAGPSLGITAYGQINGTSVSLSAGLTCTTVTGSDLLTVTRAANSGSTEWGAKVTLTQSGAGIGYAFEPSVIAAGTGSAASAACVFAKASTTFGNRDHIVAVQGQSTHNSTGTLTDLLGAAFFTVKDAASGSITNIKGVEINTPTISGGTVTNAYGLWIDNQSGATNNYAIKTGTGRVEFGDSVYLANGTGVYIGGFARFAGAGTVTNFYAGSSTFNIYNQAGDTQLVSISNTTGAATFLGGITHGSSTLLTTTVSLSNGAAASTGTLTNSPTSGNPTKWIPINDNGVIRHIPAW